MTAIAVDEADLHCPLCEYNLRGLVEPRCPECGFTFTWEELRAADRDQLPWLFENGRQGWHRAFAGTWLRSRWAPRFWREVKPTNPVNVRRLEWYWAMATFAAAALMLAPLPHGLWHTWSDYHYRWQVLAMTGWLQGAGMPANAADLFLQQAKVTASWVRERPLSSCVIGPPLMALAWPWLSFAALMVFQRSMRRAQVRPGHVLRVAIYADDFGWFVWLATAMFVPIGSVSGWSGKPDGVALAYLAMACGAVATFRLTWAYKRHLRFHRPFLTVLAAQTVVVMFALTALTLTTDLGNLFR